VKCRDAVRRHILTLLQEEARQPAQRLLYLRHPRPAVHHARGWPNLQHPLRQALFLPQDVHGIFSAIVAKDLGT